MKRLIFISLTLLLIGSCKVGKETLKPQLPIDDATHKVTYSEIILVEDSLANKQNLYSRAREWFAKAYKSANHVIQMDDKESGKIVGKGVITAYMFVGIETTEYGYYNFTMSIYVKDGRYKYEITDIYHTGEGQRVSGTNYRVSDWGTCEAMFNANKKSFNKSLTQMDKDIKLLIANLKTSMYSMEREGW